VHCCPGGKSANCKCNNTSQKNKIDSNIRRISLDIPYAPLKLDLLDGSARNPKLIKRDLKLYRPGRQGIASKIVTDPLFHVFTSVRLASLRIGYALRLIDHGLKSVYAPNDRLGSKAVICECPLTALSSTGRRNTPAYYRQVLKFQAFARLGSIAIRSCKSTTESEHR
jgi:hypothetical protein